MPLPTLMQRCLGMSTRWVGSSSMMIRSKSHATADGSVPLKRRFSMRSVLNLRRPG